MKKQRYRWKQCQYPTIVGAFLTCRTHIIHPHFCQSTKTHKILFSTFKNLVERHPCIHKCEPFGNEYGKYYDLFLLLFFYFLWWRYVRLAQERKEETHVGSRHLLSRYAEANTWRLTQDRQTRRLFSVCVFLVLASAVSETPPVCYVAIFPPTTKIEKSKTCVSLMFPYTTGLVQIFLKEYIPCRVVF